jgi:hypothetical protein
MSGRDFVSEMREAEREILECLRAEESARAAYADVQRIVTENLPHAADEERRLAILRDARQHYAQQRNATNRAIDKRSQLIDDRMQDHVVRLVRATPPVRHFVPPHTSEAPQ